jgi:hypothetical protein
VESDEPVKNVDPCDDSSTGRPPNSLNSCEVSFLNVIKENNLLTFPFFQILCCNILHNGCKDELLQIFSDAGKSWLFGKLWILPEIFFLDKRLLNS